MITWQRALLSAMICPVLSVASAQNPASPSGGGQAILDLGSCWRVHTVCRDAVVPVELLKIKRPDAAEPGLLAAQQLPGGFGRVETLPPPAEWTRPDFDDSSWSRSPGPVGGGAGHLDIRSQISLRGRFRVNDPGSVKGLVLTVGYRGGVAVYLNGQEVARQDLPQDPMTAAAAGAAYPPEAYVDDAGKLIGRRADKAVLAAAEARRNRSLGPVSLPVNSLVRGVNVLAIAIHRSDFRPEALGPGWTGQGEISWAHVEFNGLRLSADAAPGAVEASVARPKGVQVFNQDIQRVFGAGEYGDPNESLRAIRLVGGRGGAYSGQVVVGSDSTISGLKVSVGELAGAGGGAIPAGQVEVRYAMLSGPRIEVPSCQPHLKRQGSIEPAFLSLHDRAPDRVDPAGGGAVQPVWVTVRVPRDAPAGGYRGELRLSADALPETKVPIELEVIDWTLPAAGDRRLFMGIYQSPETLAMHYGVPMWSDRHWGLMDKSFQLLGQLGNKLLVVPLVCRTQFGNTQSLVPWIRKEDGSYDYDFAVHDRLVDLFVKCCRPEVVSYQVWTSHTGGYFPGIDNPSKLMFVTVVDPKTGGREQMRLPPYATEESRKLWKPLLDAVRERLAKRGLDKAMVIGLQSDNLTVVCRPIPAMFKDLLADVGWHSGAHNRMGGPAGQTGFIRYAYREYLYVPGLLPDPQAQRRCGWDNKVPAVICQRLYPSMQPPMMMRTMGERGLLLGDNGAGRMGLDYWSFPADKLRIPNPYPIDIAIERGAEIPDWKLVEKPAAAELQLLGCKKDGGYNLFSCFAESLHAQRDPFLFALARPGADGAVHSINSMAMMEGVQECEARIFVEEALVRKRISGELASRAQKVLDQRADFCRIVHAMHPYGLSTPLLPAIGDGWQKASADLYKLAAEVAANLSK